MKQIAIVGMGGISQKSYLPYMRQLPNIHWHLFTRNQAVLEDVGDLFGTSTTYESLDELLAVDLDGVFIHAATVAHEDIATAFLKAGIPVYMDKPLTEDYASTKALYDLAKEKGTFIMAGFNRRFAPHVQTLLALDDKKHILVEKNDINRPGDLTYKVFDFFIHPLDTALALADGALESGAFSYCVEDGLLSRISVNLQTSKESLMVNMNLQAGSRREVMEVQTPQGTWTLKNLEELTIHQGIKETKEGFGSWDTTLYKRGFETIIDRFLAAIDTGVNPVSPETSLFSHYICHQICQSEESTGSLNVTLPEEK